MSPKHWTISKGNLNLPTIDFSGDMLVLGGVYSCCNPQITNRIDVVRFTCSHGAVLCGSGLYEHGGQRVTTDATDGEGGSQT